MRLTSRRLWCALLLLACLLAATLTDPIARRAKQLAVRYAFDGQIAVSNVYLHRKQEMLEIDDLSSVHVADDAQVNVSSKCTLIKLDMSNLLDKRLISSKAKMHGLRIELTSLPTATVDAGTPPQSLQTAIDDLIVNFQWDAIKADCEALLTADDLLKELDAKVRGWLMRSQQIMFHADQLTSSIQNFTNPLRDMTDLRTQLKQVEQLRSEQDSLQKQFNSLAIILPDLSQEIQAASVRDVTSLRAKSNRQTDALRSQLAEQMVHLWTSHLLNRQRKLTQSLAIVFNNAPSGNPFNVDVRDLAISPSVIRMSGIEADGVFVEPNHSVAFIATGELALSQQVNFQLVPQTSWSIQYQESNVGTDLNLASLPENGAWKIRAAAHACELETMSPSDRRTTSTSLSNAMAKMQEQAKLFTVDAMLSNLELSGTAKLNVLELDALKKLPCACNADFASTKFANGLANTSNDLDVEQWIEFELSGSLLNPRVTLTSELPRELINGLTEEIQRQMETQRTACETQLAVEVESKLSELKASLERSVQQAQQTVSKQQETLSDMHSKLEQSLQSRENYEYARRPTPGTSNR